MKGHNRIIKDVVPVDIRKTSASGPKIPHEILKAIKREKETAGVNYWRTPSTYRRGNSNSVLEWKTPEEKVHSLNFEFPSGLLPVLNTAPPFKKPCSPKKSKSPVHDRQSVPDFSIPTEKQKRENNTATIFDFSTFDAITSSRDKKSPFSGLLGLSAEKVHYLDFLVDSLQRRGGNDRLSPSGSNLATDNSREKSENVKDVSREHGEINNNCVESPIEGSPGTPDIALEHIQPIVPSPRPKNIVVIETDKRIARKPSILKQSCVKLEECNDYPLCFNAYYKKAYCPNSAKSFNLEHSGSARSRSSSCQSEPRSLKSGSSKTRFVRFNIADEVREFKPSEPIHS